MIIPAKQTIILGLLVLAIVCPLQGYPVPTHNPNSEYELIDRHSIGVQSNTTRRTFVLNSTPPPPPPNSKTFAYNPMDQSWTLVKKNDPQPGEGTLLWNQSNDKFLTKK